MAIPESIKKLANDIRTKIYGRDVRESLASGIEAAGSIANDADVRSQETETKQANLEKKYDEQIANMSLENPSVAEVVDARVSGYDGQSYTTIGKRFDSVDAQLADITDVLESRSITVTTLFGTSLTPLKGDGITDNLSALNDIVTYAESKNIKKLIFPAGKFLFKGTFSVPIGFTLEGADEEHIYNGSSGKTNLIFDNTLVGIDCGRNPYVTFNNLHLDGNNTTDTVINFGYFTKMANVTVTNGISTGGKISSGQNTILYNCSFSGNGGNGLTLEDVSTTTLTFINCYFRENGGKGIGGSTSDCYFLRCTFESNIGKGVHLTDGKKLIKFESCYFEGNEMPNGYHLQLENGEYQFDNCDFGSTQIVRVANLINSRAEFRNSKHIGGSTTVPVDFDVNSKLVLIDSFEEYPINERAIRPKLKNELSGSTSWSLVNSPNTIQIDFGKTLPISNYQVFLTVDCTENIGYTISGRSESGFTVNIHQKPTGANANILWKVEY